MKKLNLSEFQFKMILFLIPFISFVLNRFIDNDFWFTINQGRYVLEHGFPTTVLFTVHNNLDFVYQSWGTGVIFYIIYKLFGTIGINVLLVLIGELIVFLFYKICYEVSEKKELSYFISIISMTVYSIFYISTRPHLFTGLNILLLIYLLEKYTKTNNNKYLVLLPLISILEVNVHGMYFFMILIYTLPYIVDSFKLKINNIETSSHKSKIILIIFILMFLSGFINPYTYKTVMYVFTSFGNNILKSTILELKPLNICDHIAMFTFVIITLLTYYFNKNKVLKMRFLLLVLGSTILTLESVKSFNFFILGGIFPLADCLNIKFQKFDNKVHNINYYVINIFILLIIVLSIVLNYKPERIQDIDAMKYLKENYPKTMTVYTEFMEGSYIEYMGYKCYMDPRAEVFLKVNNHKKDIYKEYIDLENRKIDYKDFLDKYKFDILFVNKNTTMYDNLEDDSYGYKLKFKDKYYKIYEKSK